MASTQLPVPSPSPSVETQVCSECGLAQPLTEESYDRDKHRENGFRAVCKTCRSLQRQLAHVKDTGVEELLRDLDQRTTALLLEISSKPNLDLNVLPHIANVCEELMKVWGGPRGLAQRMMANYLAARPGSQMRFNYEREALSIIKLMNEQGIGQKPIESLSDEELQKLMLQNVQRLQATVVETRNAHAQ